MGARPSSFASGSGGGGFLNGAVVTIQGYEFSDAFNGNPFVPGSKNAKGEPVKRMLNCRLVLRADGATEDVATTLKVGVFEYFTVTDDGMVITKGRVSKSFDWGLFITSLCEAGFPGESRFEDDPSNPDYADFRPIIGTRVKLGRVKDEKAAKDGIKRKDKNGKNWDIEKVVVLEVLELPKEGNTTVSGKTGGSFDVAEESEKVLKAILKGKEPKSKKRLGTMILSHLADHAHRDAIYQWLFDDKNLASLHADDVIVYDKAAGTVALPSEALVGATA